MVLSSLMTSFTIPLLETELKRLATLGFFPLLLHGDLLLYLLLVGHVPSSLATFGSIAGRSKNDITASARRLVSDEPAPTRRSMLHL